MLFRILPDQSHKPCQIFAETLQGGLVPNSSDLSSSLLTNLSASYKSTLTTVEVGPKKKVYNVHKDLLIFYSDYFRAALNGSFKEAIEGKISLHGEREDVFDIFNQFVYSRVIADEQDHRFTWDLLVATWLFGDKYMVPTLQNIIMDAILEKNRLERAVPTVQISLIWEKTLPSSPLRRFILDQVVYMMKASKLRLYEQRWTREALFDLVEAYANKKVTKKYTLPLQGKCHYHVHKEGEEC